MGSFARFMEHGGAAMYFILWATIPLLVFGVLHMILARKWTFIVALILFALPPLIGAGGYALGAIRVEAAIDAADPAYRDQFAEVGYAEARHNLYFGFGAGGVGLLPLVIGEVRRRSKVKS